MQCDIGIYTYKDINDDPYVYLCVAFCFLSDALTSMFLEPGLFIIASILYCFLCFWNGVFCCSQWPNTYAT